MSTITSPRISTSVRSATSSARTSLDLPPGQTSRPGSTQPRRNRADRAALRDYYNLKAAAEEATDAAQLKSPGLGPNDEEKSELDEEGFNAEAYVRRVLETDGLDTVLKIEGRLMSEIRGLDGDRKALVYDNYSKLIAATDTIRKMRTNMDPLTPTTSTLSPAIAHIAETAVALSASVVERNSSSATPTITKEPTEEERKAVQARKTVKWVLDAPRRLRKLVEEGDRDKAEKDWEEVKALLEKWKGVEGVEKVRKGCEEALLVEEDEDDDDDDDDDDHEET